MNCREVLGSFGEGVYVLWAGFWLGLEVGMVGVTVMICGLLALVGIRHDKDRVSDKVGEESKEVSVRDEAGMADGAGGMV